MPCWAVIDPDTADPTNVDAMTMWWPVTGTATLRSTPEGVDLALWIQLCRTSYSYPVRIYDTSNCTALDVQSKPWDRSVVAKVLCTGTGGGHLYYSRSTTDAKAWCLGGPAVSNLAGRSMSTEPVQNGFCDKTSV